VHPTEHPTEHHRNLYTVLTDYLRELGATIRLAFIDADAHWHAPTQTLTLRADAELITWLEIIRDFIGITVLGHASQYGAQPVRHLRAVG